MLLQKVIIGKTFLKLFFSWRQDPDSLVRGIDPLIRIRIHTKMPWIRNTAQHRPLLFLIFLILSLVVSRSEDTRATWRRRMVGAWCGWVCACWPTPYRATSTIRISSPDILTLSHQVGVAL
jgi:hypothetical protein